MTIFLDCVFSADFTTLSPSRISSAGLLSAANYGRRSRENLFAVPGWFCGHCSERTLRIACRSGIGSGSQTLMPAIYPCALACSCHKGS